MKRIYSLHLNFSLGFYSMILALSGAFILTSFQKLKAQATNNWAQDVVMPTPNAASLGKYGDIPVDLVSGLPNISVPIYTLEDGPLRLPISLSYHASGVRVSELSSWVGLGWSLIGGGMVSRTVMGIPDEVANGYWFAGDEVENNYDDRIWLKDVVDGIRDAEPDIFSFNVSGLSGKFYFDKNNDVHIIPKNLDIKIETTFNGSSGGF